MWRDVTEQEWLDNSRMNVVSGKIAYFRSICMDTRRDGDIPILGIAMIH